LDSRRVARGVRSTFSVADLFICSKAEARQFPRPQTDQSGAINSRIDRTYRRFRLAGRCNYPATLPAVFDLGR